VIWLAGQFVVNPGFEFGVVFRLSAGLGLGGITLHSALNQPLEAEIQLIEVGDLSADEVHVRLASEVDFVRSGVERIFFP
jgi:pilus assembly protein FimV